jgi:hypothetical protein
MIDKEVYRKNFQGGGADMGAGASGMGSGNTGGKSGGANDARDRGMGMAGKTGDYGTGPTGNDGGGNQFTGLTKDVLNPNVDYVGDTIFGPTQKYSGDGFFSGYRNLDAQGQPLMGLAYVGDRLQSMLTPSNILGGILGLINPLAGLAFRGANYLRQEIPETIDQFRDSNTLEEFRDKVRGYGTTMPVVSPTPMYGGIESLGVSPIQGVMQVADLTEKQKKLLDQRRGMYPDILGDQEMLDNISSENDPNSPATIDDIRRYYGIV